MNNLSMNMQNQKDIPTKTATVVGCGLSGAVAAVLLVRKGYIVNIYETRPHIGGNCYDAPLNNVKYVHQYGPHLFHTDDEEVFEYLSQYTQWIPFKLQPKGITHAGKISLPYSKKTISELGREYSPEEIRDLIFRDYSEKQWGVPFSEIPSTITNRIPKTANCEDPTWFEGQKYQCIPKHGYTRMFERMLYGCEDIRVHLNCEPNEWRNHPADLTIYTGKIDAYFDYCYGHLPYRSLEFHHASGVDTRDEYMHNYNTKGCPYTRSYDHSHMDPDHVGPTVITHELPKECGPNDIPYYPIPWGEGQKTYIQYEELAKNVPNTIFLGRLATYKYLDMWMTVKHALIKLKNI